MKRAFIVIFLLASPLYAQEHKHYFSLALTGSLGLLGEYTNRSLTNWSPNHFTNEAPKGGAVPCRFRWRFRLL